MDQGRRMIEKLIRDQGGVATPRSEREAQLLREVLEKVQDLCNGMPRLPEDVARNRDRFADEIMDALDRYYDTMR